MGATGMRGLEMMKNGVQQAREEQGLMKNGCVSDKRVGNYKERVQRDECVGNDEERVLRGREGWI